jgi:spore photoproduct lyase
MVVLQKTLDIEVEHSNTSESIYVPYPRPKTRDEERAAVKRKNKIDPSIITEFNVTPYPKKDDEVWCPHFMEFKPFNGCPFKCAWCYLQGTFRWPAYKKLDDGTHIAPRLKDEKRIVNSLLSYFDKIEKPTLLNSGEVSDSFAFPDFMFEKIIPLFVSEETNPHRHKLLILTKHTAGEKLAEIEAQDVVVYSASLNSYPVAEKWEIAPHPKERIKVAKKIYDSGYEVRIRIDPMVPIENYKKGYLKLVDDLMTSLVPSRITLGSLRGLQSTINNSSDKSWVKYLGERSNWGRKIPFETRKEMYLSIINYLKDEYNYRDVALCKETLGMWNAIGMDWRKIKCNCIW